MNQKGEKMTHREVLEAMSGLMLGMLVAILSSTVVSSSLPKIISDLNGGQASYTWVVTSTLLALTVTTPIWGKLADLFDRKLLVQTALLIFVTGSILAGFAHSTSWLIGCRVLQGVGAGGLTALVQVVMSDLISPRERGRYMGYLGAVMSLGTIGGPLLGGVITDSIGWRWNFFVGVPVAVLAIIVLQKTLHLPKKPKQKVFIDYWGAFFLATGVSVLLIWVSLAGHNFDWISWPTFLMLFVSIAALIALLVVEKTTKEPLIPLRLFKDKTIVFANLASVAVGIAMFGTSLFLAQYMQLARGETPTMSGILTLPMIVGVMLSSIVMGRVIAKTGRYKKIMLTGAALVTTGLICMATINETTSFWWLSLFMFLLGSGVGMLMQNVVLVVQNSSQRENIGAATSLVAFTRSLAGATAVAVLGAILSSRVTQSINNGLQKIGIAPQDGGGKIPQVNKLPDPIREIVEHAYGTGIAELFMVAIPAGVLAFVAVWFIKEKSLKTTSGIEELQIKEQAAVLDEPKVV